MNLCYLTNKQQPDLFIILLGKRKRHFKLMIATQKPKNFLTTPQLEKIVRSIRNYSR